jgi:hypothetical protein
MRQGDEEWPPQSEGDNWQGGLRHEGQHLRHGRVLTCSLFPPPRCTPHEGRGGGATSGLLPGRASAGPRAAPPGRDRQGLHALLILPAEKSPLGLEQSVWARHCLGQTVSGPDTLLQPKRGLPRGEDQKGMKPFPMSPRWGGPGPRRCLPGVEPRCCPSPRSSGGVQRGGGNREQVRTLPRRRCCPSWRRPPCQLPPSLL